MKELCITLVLTSLLLGCSGSQPYIRGAILPPTDGGYVPCSNDGKVESHWTPTGEQVSGAEAAILGYIKESDPSIFANLKSYRCQYTGIIVKGQKRIFCNFFWYNDDWRNWETDYVFVLDGGADYFQLEYDINTGKCLNFSVNGEA